MGKEPREHRDPAPSSPESPPRGFELRWLPAPWHGLPIRPPISGDGSAAGCSGYDLAVGTFVALEEEP